MTDGPMSSWDLEVSRADLSVMRVVSGTQPLGEGEVLLAVERLAVTANILTYASLGDELGYWRLFPAAPGWGRIPAWGDAVVVGSRQPDFDLGARYFGMLPMSSHVVVKPRKTRRGFADDEPNRRSLSAVYNQYFDTGRQTLSQWRTPPFSDPSLSRPSSLTPICARWRFSAPARSSSPAPPARPPWASPCFLRASFRRSGRHHPIVWTLSKRRASMRRFAHTETPARSIGKRKP